jgi:hypothetical protein
LRYNLDLFCAFQPLPITQLDLFFPPQQSCSYFAIIVLSIPVATKVKQVPSDLA